MKKLFFILSFFSLTTFAQTAQTEFGKNRVQYKQVEWKFISTKNFNVYYYIGGNNLAYNTARHLEEKFNAITHTVGYLPYNKINVLVYTNDTDLQQSNIGLENNISAGGETALIKSRFEISFKGSQVEYYKELDKKLSELFINIIMYGGSFRDKVQSSYLIDFPAWFIIGCSNYLGYGETEEMYNAVQDFIYSKKKNPDRLTGEYAGLVGQSIYHFIKEKYGDYAIANILALTRATRNEEAGIRGSVGLDYATFLAEWRKYYLEKIEVQTLDKKQRLKRTSNVAAITQLKINKDHSKIAYAVNRKGIYYVYVHDLSTDKKKIVYYGGVKNTNWVTDQSIPLIAWKSNEELCLIKYKRGKPYLVTKNIHSRFQKEKKLFVTFDAILSFDFAPNEDDMVLSGVKDGQTDIYVYNTKDDVAKQITKDLYDDFDPCYSPDGSKILFSTNRYSDTLRGDYGSFEKIKDNYNLFIFDGSKILKRVTNSNLNEKKAIYWNKDRIVFLATNGQMNQLYTLTIGDQIAKNIETENKNINKFIAIQDDLFLFFTRKEKDYIQQKSGAFTIQDKNNYLALNSVTKDTTTPKIPNQVLINDLLLINPDDQGYDSDPKKKKEIASTENTKEKILKINGPMDVTPLMAIDYVVSTIQIDPIRNIGVLFESGTSDMFGNHRFKGKLFTSANLKSSDMMVQYEYLKHQYDFRLKLRKNSYFRVDDNNFIVQRQSRTDFLASVAKPFSPVARIEYNTGINRNSSAFFNTPSKTIDYNLYFQNEIKFIYDNTFEKSLNQFQGFRMKVYAQNTARLSGAVPGFNKIGLDMRNYQPIFRDIVLATRFSYGRFSGKLPRVFLLGGVDNWLVQSYEQNDQFDPLYLNQFSENPYLLYSDFVTNMRGFGYNKMNGANHFLLNAEIRIPIIRVLYSGPITSSFFRNLQLNCFYEAGSAWNGSHPFNQDNSINTRVLPDNGNPFTGTVINYQNPIISAYGFGLRSMIYGYYLKFDLGWGIQNYVVKKPKLQISLGYDF